MCLQRWLIKIDGPTIQASPSCVFCYPSHGSEENYRPIHDRMGAPHAVKGDDCYAGKYNRPGMRLG